MRQIGAQQRRREFVVLGLQQRVGAGPAPPIFDAEILGIDRLRDQDDVGHRAAELEQRAAHMVVGGHQAQARIALARHEGGGLARVARRRIRVVAEFHAAFDRPRRLARHAQQFLQFHAARHARQVHGLERVAIVDWDVHHGNGTQEIFWADKSVMYCSTHEMPLYPGTGAAHERGEHNTIVNVPLRAGDGGAEFREAFEVGIIPRLEEFRPDLVIISAGFDAHLRDPLANLNLVEADFAWATTQLMDIADRFSNGRVVSLLEGGYDLEGLARSTAAHVMTLMRAG